MHKLMIGASLASLAVAPRAVAMNPRAETVDPAEAFRQLRVAHEGYQARNNARFDEIEAAVDNVLRIGASGQLGGLGDRRPEDPEYSALFASYMRRGEGEVDLRRANAEGFRAQVRAAMSVGTAGDGGYLAPTEWDRQVRQAQAVVSPMRRIATVMTTGVGAFSTVWSNNSWGSGWVGETAARPATTTPTLSSLEFAGGEIYANPAITQRLLDDSSLDLEAWIASQVADEFARQEGIAFISGNGTNKPFGLLTYVDGGAADDRHPGGNLTTVETAAASTIAADDLVGFLYGLAAPYRQGAVWLMNSTTAARIGKLKDSDGAYIWRESFAQGDPAKLLGYPVEIDESMPNVADSALPIAFGNFKRGYLINDRLGISTLRDPFTNKPYVNFYATKRVGGGVLDPNAIRLLKIKAA